MKQIRLQPDEVREIIQLANTQSVKYIADWIGISETAVRYHLRKAGVKPAISFKWRDDDVMIQRFIRMYANEDLATIAKQFNVSILTVPQIASILRTKGYNVPYIKKRKNEKTYHQANSASQL